MPDVFISYRRADRAKAEALAKALKLEALDVWWDAALETGQTFDEATQAALLASKSVLVLWSPAAAKSEWVRAESSVGRERGVLVPVMVRSCVIPVPFNVLQTADLTGWNGDRAHLAYRDVVKQLKAHAGKALAPPLKPPPNRQLRALWRTVAAVAVLAVAGASLWLFKPWEAMKPVDPAIVAKAARDASLARLVQFGVSPADFEQLSWNDVIAKRFKADSYPELAKLADAGDHPAQALACAADYWREPTRSENLDAARKNCRLSAEAGEPIGETYYAYMLRRTDPPAAADWFKKASDQGFSWGQLGYANRLMDGTNVAKDAAHAEELLKAVAAKGVVEADYALGVAYWEGRFGRPSEHELGLRYLQQAADRGHYLAMYNLANRYRDGAGVPRDFAKARGLYDKLIGQSENTDLADSAKSGLRDLEQQEAERATPDASTPSPR